MVVALVRGEASAEMSLYKHMKQLAAARDDESRPLAERFTAAEVLETTARIVYERAKEKARELNEKQIVSTANVFMETFADALRCHPETKK